MADNKKAWWAVCDGCDCTTVVVMHWSGEGNTPSPEDWDRSSSCPVCGGWLGNQWNSDDAADVHLS